MRPMKVPRTLDRGVEIAASNAALDSAPMIGLAPPPITTVMNATSTNCVPISGTIVVVGAYSAPVRPAKAEPAPNVSR